MPDQRGVTSVTPSGPGEGAVPALELREIYSWFNDANNPALPRPPGTNVVAKTLWGAGDTGSNVDTEIYVIAAGGVVDAHSHPDHMELVICWQGTGKVTIAEPAAGGGFQPAYQEF